MEEYDPASDTWKECTPIEGPRMAMGCTVLADKIYLIGGMTPETGELYRAIDRVDVYDSKSHSYVLIVHFFLYQYLRVMFFDVIREPLTRHVTRNA